MSATDAQLTDADALAGVRSLARRLVAAGSIGPAGDVRDMLAASLYDDVPTPGPSFRAWMQAHDGKRLDTLQTDAAGSRGWMPTGRLLDAHTRAGSFTLDGSRRDYVGVRVISATAAGLLAVDRTSATVLVYRVSP